MNWTSSFQSSLSLIPAVIVGFGLGVLLVKKSKTKKVTAAVDPTVDRAGWFGHFLSIIIWRRLRLLFPRSRRLLPVPDRSYRFRFLARSGRRVQSSLIVRNLCTFYDHPQFSSGLNGIGFVHTIKVIGDVSPGLLNAEHILVEYQPSCPRTGSGNSITYLNYWRQQRSWLSISSWRAPMALQTSFFSPHFSAHSIPKIA